MIGGIINGNTAGYLYVNNGHGGSMPYVSPDHNNPMQGIVRLNGTNLEVFTGGSNWSTISMAHADVNLSPTAIAALDWANKKMAEEAKIQELAKKNVTVADALARYEQAQAQLKMVLTLTDEV